MHMIGLSSYKLFKSKNDPNMEKYAQTLLKGIQTYWTVAAIMLLVFRSVSFVFWIYLQPLLCMSYFLALINIGFHGFIEFDANGKHIDVVNSTAIIEGDDDYFGEDDHMAHHYHMGVYYKDLKKLQATEEPEFKKHKASVFRGLSIVELSIFILLGLWDECAKHYVDYTGKMSKDEIKEMLKRRATTVECDYFKYDDYMNNPSPEKYKELLETSNKKNR